MRPKSTLLAIAAAIVGACGRPAQPPAQPAANEDPRAARRAQLEAEEAKEQADRERELGPCDDESYDFRRLACRSFCPSYPVAGEPMCDSVCPRNEPQPHIRACQYVMPCPTPPDRRVAACMRTAEQRWPVCDRQNPMLTNPRCDGVSRVPGTLSVMRTRDDGRYDLRIAPCGNRGVATGWRGHLVDTEHGTDVAGTDFEVTGATEYECAAVTAAAIDPTLIGHSTRVWMAPP